MQTVSAETVKAKQQLTEQCSWWGWPPTDVLEDEGFHSTEMKPLKFCPSAEAETGLAVAPEQNCPQKLTV